MPLQVPGNDSLPLVPCEASNVSSSLAAHGESNDSSPLMSCGGSNDSSSLVPSDGRSDSLSVTSFGVNPPFPEHELAVGILSGVQPPLLNQPLDLISIMNPKPDMGSPSRGKISGPLAKGHPKPPFG